MATLPQLRAGYTRLNRRLIRGAGDRAAALFRSLPDWRDDNAAVYLQQLEPILDGVKLQTGRLRVAYASEIAKAAGQPFTATAVTLGALATPNLRNGATFEQVHTRPFATLYTALSQGKTVSQAIFEGATRASSVASTDVQLASRQAGRASRSENPRVVGYRRVLSGGKNCALCVIASTQRYTVNDLMPIHPGCSCGEEEIYGDFDPGQIIDPELLDETQSLIARELEIDPDAGARDAGLGKVISSPTEGDKLADYTELIVSRNHGEYGPTLSFRDQSFTRASDIPAALDGNL
jgi:hypothetical protein